MAPEPIEDPLPASEKKRIRLEEHYRLTVRDELQQRTKANGGLLGFLNSSFGLWLLSALFISGIGTVYTDHQNRARANAQMAESKRVEENRIKELTQRIDLEISYRLSLAMSRLEAANHGSDKGINARLKETIRTAIVPLTLPTSEQTPPLFPEFKLYSGLALIAELRRHVSEGEKVRLRKVLASLTGLVGSIESDSTGKAHTPSSVAGDLVSTMKSQRWDNGFHYTDCSREKPFC